MNLKRLVRGLTPPLLAELYFRCCSGTYHTYIWDGIYAHYREVPVRGPGHVGGTWIEETQAHTRWIIAEAQKPATYPTYVSSYYSLMAILVATLRNPVRPVRILDFGGSMGCGYVQLMGSLSNDAQVEYHIVDNQQSCTIGSKLFRSEERVRFHSTLPKLAGTVDLLFLGSVLQYIEDYAGLLQQLLAYRPRWVLLVFHPIGDIPTFATAQNNIKGSVLAYWFFNVHEVVALFQQHGYRLIFRNLVERKFNMENFPVNYRLEQMSNLLFEVIEGV